MAAPESLQLLSQGAGYGIIVGGVLLQLFVVLY